MTRPVLHVDRAAPERVHLDDTTWIDVVRGFVPDAPAVFEAVRDGYRWEVMRTWRYEKHREHPRLVGTLPQGAPLPHVALRQAQLVLEQRYRVRLRGPHVLQYRDGRDWLGFHSDRELVYLDDTLICGLSLGAARPLAVRCRATDETRELELGSGDLYVMGGRTQADWLHAVPPVDGAGPKVSVLWRWTSRTGRPEGRPGAMAPRRYGRG